MNYNNKLLAKNTILMYIRMFVVIIITMYSTRIVLDKLGIVDYGIYSIVSGILVLLSFFNSSLNSACTRYLSFELGKENNEDNLKKTFSSCVLIHFVICVLISIISLLIGPNLIENYLVIPSERILAANYVFYFSILSVVFQILQTPFKALIVAYERMNVLALIEIINAFLKLIIVYFLCFSVYDKLVLYSELICFVSLLIFIFSLVYCKVCFQECTLKPCIQINILLPMINYTGWQFYGNLSLVAITQGINFLLNINFGPIMNTAYDISSRVSGVILGMSANLVTALTPQIIKAYSGSDTKRMMMLMKFSSKIMLLLMLYICAPLIIECPQILSLWLSSEPPYVVNILRLMLLWNIIVSMSSSIGIVATATGDMKLLCFISGTMYLSIFPISYFSFEYGAPYWVPFLLNSIVVVFAPVYVGITIKKYIKSFSWYRDIIYDQIKGYFVIVCSLTILFMFSEYVESSIFRIFLTFSISCFTISLLVFFLVFTKQERTKVKSIIYSKLKFG